jgi:tRNA (mo5U34)-methyltransferase
MTAPLDIPRLKAGLVRRVAQRPTGVAPLDRQVDRLRTVRRPQRSPLAEQVASSPGWFHSIDLGGGVVTPGIKSADQLAHELDRMCLPDLHGSTVLDIGAWDGYFSFACERAGASRVVALDHYSWSVDWPAAIRYVQHCTKENLPIQPWHEVPSVWRPWRLPGRRNFETAHEALKSRVEPVVGDIATVPTNRLGTFDVVLFLGVLYHLEDPLGVLRRVAEVTAGLAIIETEAIAIHGHDERALFEFFPTDERAGDPTNWWAPTEQGLRGLCRAAGFTDVKVVLGAPVEPTPEDPLIRYRLMVHARR